MTWHLRAIEHDDGQWQCRRGSIELDRHADVDSAVRHLTELAAALGPARLLLHPLHGDVWEVTPEG